MNNCTCCASVPFKTEFEMKTKGETTRQLDSNNFTITVNEAYQTCAVSISVAMRHSYLTVIWSTTIRPWWAASCTALLFSEVELQRLQNIPPYNSTRGEFCVAMQLEWMIPRCWRPAWPYRCNKVTMAIEWHNAWGTSSLKNTLCMLHSFNTELGHWAFGP